MGNHNSGRRPDPTALKILRGVPGHRKLPEHEVRPPSGEVTKPAGLSAGAAVVWDRIAPVCLYMGTLTTADVPTFGRMCELQATAEQASAMKDTDGFTYFDVKDGSPHPCLRVERETATALRPYYDYFGMTPPSRARISVPKPKDQPESKWAGALK